MAATIEINLTGDTGGGRGGRNRGSGTGAGGGGADPGDDLPEGEGADPAADDELLDRVRKQLARDNLIKRGRRAGLLPTPDDELPIAKEIKERDPDASLPIAKEIKERDPQDEFDRNLRKQLARESLYRRAGLTTDPAAERQEAEERRRADEREAREREAERRDRDREQRDRAFQLRERIGFTGAVGQRAAATAGQFGTGAARNDVSGALNSALDAAAMGLSRLGPIGMAAGVGLKVVGEAANAAKNTIDAFVARARELAGVNGNIAGAAARADAQRYMDDIREAEELGPQLAKIIENQSKAEQVQRELLLPIKQFLLEVLNQGIENSLQALLGILEATNKAAAIPELTRLVARIKEIIEGTGAADPIATWLGALSGFAAPPPVGPAPGRIGVPFRGP